MILTPERLKEILKCNFETGKLYWKIKRGSNRVRPGDEAGSVDARGYIVVKIDGITYKGHRLVWCLYFGRWPELEIDHINRNLSDNRIINLREATRSENMGNMPVRKDSKTGVKGVTWMKSSSKFRADIRVNGKLIYLGLFDSVDKAAKAYAEAASNYFGRFGE